MKFQIPRIGWEMDNDGEVVETPAGLEVHVTFHGGKVVYKPGDKEVVELIEHLREMVEISNNALTVLTGSNEVELPFLLHSREKGVLDLTQDEYVRQVGTWKIIQRLEEERDELKSKLSEVRRD